MDLALSGDMLFEGANTLQFSGESQLEVITSELNINSEALESALVSSAILTLDDPTRAITESLLLQIVSDNNELITIGTLSPLPEGNKMTLSLAEEPAILNYLKDEGTTWVLDLNITEEHMDEMNISAAVSLNVDYVPTAN
ncbi:hypothetical protein O3Q51_16790 [Cryomorphaceae bacterium 1068]|nr:hypothetical protein [Cryomorphaceae bacterium 1068]